MHFDHTGGNAAVIAATGATLLAHANARDDGGGRGATLAPAHGQFCRGEVHAGLLDARHLTDSALDLRDDQR